MAKNRNKGKYFEEMAMHHAEQIYEKVALVWVSKSILKLIKQKIILMIYGVFVNDIGRTYSEFLENHVLDEYHNMSIEFITSADNNGPSFAPYFGKIIVGEEILDDFTEDFSFEGIPIVLSYLKNIKKYNS